MDASTLYLTGLGLKFGSTIGQGISSLSEGSFARKAREYEAGSYERAASDERASAQRQAFEQRKATDRLISKQIAGAAA
jgi:hypothetical protein